MLDENNWSEWDEHTEHVASCSIFIDGLHQNRYQNRYQNQ